MKLIAGLGNPGRYYAHNRHNIGFMCLSHLARTQDIRLDRKQGNARTGIGKIAGHEVVLARPQTGMNLSGDAISRLVNRYRMPGDDLIIIHDDLDLPLWKIRIRYGGRSAGHKGINSVINHLGNTDFYRIKVGIGRPDMTNLSAREKDAVVVNYVLSDFSPEERNIISGVIPQVSEAIICLLDQGLTAAMNRYN